MNGFPQRRKSHLSVEMPTTCVIAFDNNPDKVFYGGQLLTGKVTLTTTKEKTIRGISGTCHHINITILNLI